MKALEVIPVSHARVFHDRAEAGRRLAEALAAYRGQDALVLGIPRGGVPVAAEVARDLKAELDLVVARKLGAPFQPELAIGAVTANGGLFLDQETVEALGITENYLHDVIHRESEVAHQREERFRGAKPAPRVEGRTVLVVDDGLATGATMRAAVRSVRKRRPGKLVVAVPVGSHHACAMLWPEADELVCLTMPEPFYAVGLYYADFAPVDDREVQRILDEFAAVSANVAAPVDAAEAAAP
jgi:putative phosphoribosyl transferase